MNEINPQDLLARMRVLGLEAQNQQPPVEAPRKADAPGFGEILDKALSNVSELQAETGRLRTAFETGEPGVDLPQVMLASQKSSVAFQGAVQVRNKLLEAYRAISKMSV